VWGSWSIASFVGLALGVALLIALSFLASPLIAFVLFVVIGIPALLLLVMRGRADTPDAERRRPATTTEGRPQTPTGSSSGAPASGEG
jgi:fatty acid desaturase